jgi:hypothetical protein
VVLPFHVPSSSAEFHFLHVLTNIIIITLKKYFAWQPFYFMWSDTYCDFDLHFPNDWDGVEHFFMLTGYFNIFFGEMSSQVLCTFKNYIVYFLVAYL